MISQNRLASFQQAKADHDFVEPELELKTNTGLTRAIHAMTAELHGRLPKEGEQRADRPRRTRWRPRTQTGTLQVRMSHERERPRTPGVPPAAGVHAAWRRRP
jgi:hypothetical protein